MDENNIKQWQLRKLIQSLEKARGNGTSMISLIIPPKDQISRYGKMLADEIGTASNIKSRVNRLSVLSAITSTQQKLKLYTKVPSNGLVIYCGTILTDENKEKMVNIDIEPHRPINTSLYLCDNKFHTEALRELMETDEKYGFIIIDGSGTLFGMICGNTRTVLHKITVELPNKHRRGGQSSVRFARLRMEKRHNYLHKIAELSTQFFIENDKPNVSGLILAGSADFKTELSKTDMFDQRLQKIILKMLDVSYGGEAGFNQAIEMASEDLKNVKFVQEKKLIGSFFDEIARNTGKYCYGIKDTIQALENGAVESLLLYEEVEMYRYLLKDKRTKEEKIFFGTEKDISALGDYDVLEKVPLVEWFVENYKSFGTELHIVSNRSQEGSQFQKGFGGIGGLLRYKMEFVMEEEDYEDLDFDFD